MRPRVALLALLLAAAVGCSANVEGTDTRPAAQQASKAWAQKIDKPGLPNLHRVTDGLYRGAQPDAEGFRELAKMGIKTVINLRAFNSDKDEIGDTKLAYVEIPMHAWHAEDEDVTRFLKIVTDKSRLPAFVHCQHGADRTGTMCAIYRLVVCGWTKDETIKEMTEGGFGYHEIWTNLINYIRKLDVEKIKRDAGLEAKPKADGACLPRFRAARNMAA